MKQKLDKVSEIQITYRPAIGSKPVIISSYDAFIELIEFFPNETIALQEKFVVMYLNRANRVLGVYELSTGGITGTLVDIRLILSVALKIVATGIILCHNHPSGSLIASTNDIYITKRVIEACKIFDIQVRDHLIISPEGKFISMAGEGDIEI